MPHSPPALPVVAIFDSTDETIETLTRLLEEHGWQTVIGRIEEIQSGVGSLGTGGLVRALAISQAGDASRRGRIWPAVGSP